MNQENLNSDAVIFEDAIWFRLLLATTIFTSGAFAIEKHLLPLYSAPVFLFLSVVFYIKARGYVHVDNQFIKISGPMAVGSLKQLPIDKIKLIDSVTSSGMTNFRVWFDPCIIRSEFWYGTDNLLFLSPITIRRSNELLRIIILKAKTATIDESVTDYIEGKKQIKSMAGKIILGGISLLFAVVSLVLIIKEL